MRYMILVNCVTGHMWLWISRWVLVSELKDPVFLSQSGSALEHDMNAQHLWQCTVKDDNIDIIDDPTAVRGWLFRSVALIGWTEGVSLTQERREELWVWEFIKNPPSGICDVVSSLHLQGVPELNPADVVWSFMNSSKEDTKALVSLIQSLTWQAQVEQQYLVATSHQTSFISNLTHERSLEHDLRWETLVTSYDCLSKT